MQDSGLKVRTEPIRVRIFTPDFEIEGQAHAKPGGYAGRVTDVLNMSKVYFMPITDARYRARGAKASDFTDSECIVIRVSSIEILEFF